MSPRSLTLAAVGTALAASSLLAGCSTGPADEVSAAEPSTSSSVDAGAFPVTIHHAYGDTTIEKEPTRIATIGTQDPDNLLALGVVPVGVLTISWGGNANGSTPWFDDKLAEMGATAPTQYSDADGIPVDDIAKLAPDLILATNSGITQQEYDKLSKIAPVVAYPGDAWTTTWQQSLEMDGQALGREALAKQVEQQTEQAIDDAKTTYPVLAGKTFIWGALSTADLSSISYYTPEDARPLFLTELGMENAPIIEKLSKKGQFYGTVSAERAADLRSDVMLSYAEKDSDAQTYTDDPLVGQIPAIKAGHLATFLANPVALSGTIPTPLSIPYAIAHFVPKIAAALQ